MHHEGFRTREGRKVVRSRMHEMLSSPMYCGKVVWKGKVSEGKQEPIVSKELFNMVQEKLTRKVGTPQYKKHLPVFKAKIECDECKGTITWEIQKGHWYGHCNHYRNCNQREFVRQEIIENQLFPYFDNVAPKNERVLKLLEKGLKESHQDEITYTTTQREQLTQSISKLDKRLEIIYEDKIDGRINVEFYQRKFEEYTKQKEDALASLKKLTNARTAYYEAGYSIHELASKAKDIYLSPKATTEEKRLLLSKVFSNLTLNADTIKPNYTLAFAFLLEWMPKVNSSFELAENRFNKGEKDAFASLHPVVLPRWTSSEQWIGSKYYESLNG